MIVSLMMDPVHVSVHCAGVHASYCLIIGSPFCFLQCMNTEVVVVSHAKTADV